MIRWLKLVFLLCVVAVIAITVWFYHYVKTPLNLPSEAQQITIAPNSALPSIAKQLVDQKVIKQTLPFIVLARFTEKASSLQAGNFSLNHNITPIALLEALQNGKAKQTSIRFIEGKTFKVMREILRKHQSVKQTIKGLSDAKVLALVTDKQKHPEGLFLPDTFYFDDGTKDVDLLKLSYSMMQNRLEKAWQNRAKELPYKNSYEALIMASIIEKETGKASERPIIAGVFVNRLRIG